MNLIMKPVPERSLKSLTTIKPYICKATANWEPNCLLDEI